MRKTDTLWLDIADEEASCIVRHTYRLRTLIYSLRCPSSQTPSLVLFFESPARRYFPASKVSGVHLRLDTGSGDDAQPFLVARTTSVFSHWPPSCVSAIERNNESTVQERVFPRQESVGVLPKVLLPFTDVLCFMCVNQSDVHVIEAQVSQWMLTGRGTGAACPMPEIVILLAENPQLRPSAIQRQLAKRLSGAKISVVRIDNSTWASQGLKPIRKRLGEAAARVRRWRTMHKLLFSGLHMMALLEESLVTATANNPFRYVEASRRRHPVAVDLAHHLSNFAGVLPASYDEGFAADSIASSFLVDHFTPGMHGSFVDAFRGTLPQRNPLDLYCMLTERG